MLSILIYFEYDIGNILVMSLINTHNHFYIITFINKIHRYKLKIIQLKLNCIIKLMILFHHNNNNHNLNISDQYISSLSSEMITKIRIKILIIILIDLNK